MIVSKIDKIYFSASHIQETLEIRGRDENQRNEWINQRLETIQKFTKNCYINENLQNEVYEFIESPFDVLQTITEVSFAQDAMKGMMNFISEGQKIEIQKMLGVDSQRLNNYDPTEVVEHLTKKINESGDDNSFLSIIENGISFHPDAHTFGRSNRIAAIFEILDMLGYWKDKVTDKSNYARLWDSSHTFYASYCDFFISNDKRTINKAKVVYDIYDIKTIILTPNVG